MDKYDCLKLESQLCFPLYACSKAVTRHYKPYLDELDLTYTQYITMMVLWDVHSASLKELGDKLYLDSGTLTPVIKKLESKGYITKSRARNDERIINIEITDAGMRLREEAVNIPSKIGGCVNINEQDARELYRLLYLILGHLENEDDK